MQELGESISVSYQQVQKYEKGVNVIAPGLLARISLRLDKPISWFFNVTEGGAGRDLGILMLQSSYGATMAEIWVKKLSAADRQAVLHLATYLSGGR
jgi:transcriptional regulator with XRE-family HTH domain